MSAESCLTEGKKALCVCDYRTAARTLEQVWRGFEGFTGSLAEIEAGAMLAAALRGLGDEERAVPTLREALRADRSRGFRYFGWISARAAYLNVHALAPDAARGATLRQTDPQKALEWIGEVLEDVRALPKRQAAGHWLERARCLELLGRRKEASEAANAVLRTERHGGLADGPVAALEEQIRAQAAKLLRRI